MKHYLFRAIIISAIAFLASCSAQSSDQENTDKVSNPTYGTWQDQPEPPLKFELEQTYGDNEEILFPQSYQLVGPVTDNSGNLYIIDGQNGTMYSFDSEGNLQWGTGEEGTGPGDFERPRGLITDGEYLYTGNISGSRIDQFDLEGNLINSTSLESLDLSFTAVEGFISDSLLVVTSTLWGNLGDKVSVLNTKDDMKVTSQFNIILAPDVELGDGLSSGTNIEIVDTLIAAGNVQDYSIQFYDKTGNEVKSIARSFDRLVRPGFFQSGGSRTIRSYGGLNAPIYLPSGYYLTTLSWPTNVDDPDDFLKRGMNDRENATEPNFENAIDLYDADGTLLYSLGQEERIPEIGSISHVDENGNIYTKRNDPFPQIRRYNLTVNAPDG